MPRHKPYDRALSAFVPIGPEGDLLRDDGRTWRTVVLEAIERISDPTARPDMVRRHVVELLRLAEVADAVRGHFFGDSPREAVGAVGRSQPDGKRES